MRILAGLATALSMSSCYLDHTLDPAGDGGAETCDSAECAVAAALDGLRWELPCRGPTDWPEVCATDERLALDTVLSGEPGARYAITLRFRGVVETKTYAGGTETPPLDRGGRPDDSDWNLYALRIGSPSSRLFLNEGPTSLHHCIAIDEVATVEVDSGARVSLEAEVFDAREIRNRDSAGRPIVVPDTPPAPEPYDGQFIQMDVLAIERAR